MYSFVCCPNANPVPKSYDKDSELYLRSHIIGSGRACLQFPLHSHMVVLAVFDHAANDIVLRVELRQAKGLFSRVAALVIVLEVGVDQEFHASNNTLLRLDTFTRLEYVVVDQVGIFSDDVHQGIQRHILQLPWHRRTVQR
jgi:hypothetical protein